MGVAKCMSVNFIWVITSPTNAISKRGSVTPTWPLLFLFREYYMLFYERMGEIQYQNLYWEKAEAISIRPLWHRKVTRSLLFARIIKKAPIHVIFRNLQRVLIRALFIRGNYILVYEEYIFKGDFIMKKNKCLLFKIRTILARVSMALMIFISCPVTFLVSLLLLKETPKDYINGIKYLMTMEFKDEES